jgi:hypothetical protein
LYNGPYTYLPFGYNYIYDYRNILPFDINSALLPVYDHDTVDDINKLKNESKTIENFKSNINKIGIPKGYKIIILRVIELKDSVNNTNSNLSLIFIILLIIIICFILYKLSKTKK